MIRTLIIDDEPDAVESLSLLLKEFCKSVSVEGTANSFQAGLKEINLKKPDLVFMDVEMPNGDGFDILDCFPDRSFHTIFVTAYNNYAIKAIKNNAIDYLLKPIDIDELQAAVNRVNEAEQQRKLVVQANMTESLGAKICIPTTDGYYYLSIKEIIHLKAEGSYTHIFTADNKSLMVSKNLKEFESILSNKGFCRIHNSHIVNMAHISRYIRTDGGYAVMSDNSKIEVSRNRKEQFLKMIGLPA